MFSPSPTSPRFLVRTGLTATPLTIGAGPSVADSHGSKTMNDTLLNPAANGSLMPGANAGKSPLPFLNTLNNALPPPWAALQGPGSSSLADVVQPSTFNEPTAGTPTLLLIWPAYRFNWKSAMAARVVTLSGVARCAWPWVASLAWLISASRMAGRPSLSRPSHMASVLKDMFTDGRGRRKSENSLVLANPYGSLITVAVKSAPAGNPMPTRMSPWLSSMLNDFLLAARLDVSAKTPVGAFDPS